MILAPLRGVTICAFRKIFERSIVKAGFTEAFTPFISAIHGVNPLKSPELSGKAEPIKLTPQFIGKDPIALKDALATIKEAGYDTADLNCGCPYPMVRNKGRGSGILETPKVLAAMLKAGCEVMGEGKFSIKARLGVQRNDELLKLMPLINDFPLRFMVVHARNARQMYSGVVDLDSLAKIQELAKMPIVQNGDLDWRKGEGMVGRSFIRELGAREDISKLMTLYINYSRSELSGDRPVLGRMKELIAYWKDLPQWKKRWNLVKISRSVDELQTII